MLFPDQSKRAGFFENNIFTIPLKQWSEIKNLENEMPEDIRRELENHLNERTQKFNQMKDDNMDMQSSLFESEKNYLGQEFKPKVISEDEHQAKMNEYKAMEQEIGKEVNEKLKDQPFVNHEGLKRIYKPKNKIELVAEAEGKVQPQKIISQEFDATKLSTNK